MRRAFTLAEVILTLGLITVVVLTLVTLEVGALRSSSDSQARYSAIQIARQLLESIVARPPAPTLARTVYDGRRGDAVDSGFPPAPYPQVRRDQLYTLQVSVTAAQRRLRCYRVDVFYAGRTVTMETYAP